MARRLQDPSEELAARSPDAELRATAARELQRSVGQLEVMHARMELLGQRGGPTDELEVVREGTRLALWSLRRIVEQLREDA